MSPKVYVTAMAAALFLAACATAQPTTDAADEVPGADGGVTNDAGGPSEEAGVADAEGGTDDAPADVPQAANLDEITAVVCDDEPQDRGDMNEYLPASGGTEVIPFEQWACTHDGEQAVIDVYKNFAQQVRLLAQIGYAYTTTPVTPATLQDRPYVCGDYWSVVVENMSTRDQLLQDLGGVPCP